MFCLTRFLQILKSCAFAMCALTQAYSASFDESAIRKQQLEQIDNAAYEAYLVVVEEYNRRVAARPYDVLATLQHCDFLNDVSIRYLDGGPSWASEVEDAIEECETEAAESFPDHPEVVLREYERTYADDAIAAGKQLLTQDLSLWSSSQVARIYVHLATAADIANDRMAKTYALNALDRDQAADVRLVAARWLIRDRENDKALEVLTSVFDEHGSDNAWYLVEKAKLLAELNAKDEVLAVGEQLKQLNQRYYNKADLAQAFAAVNALDEARAQVDAIGDDGYTSNAALFQRFLLEYRSGTPAEALAAYNGLRDKGLSTDPVLQYRLSLLSRSIALPWQVRDLLGLATALGVFLLLAAAAAIVIVPVHYRSLARRLASRVPDSPLPSWSLRNAWYALFVVFASSYVAIYFVGPMQFQGGEWNWDQLFGNQNQLSSGALIESAIQLLAAIPLLWLARSNGSALFTHYSLVKAIWVGVFLGVLFRLPSVVLFSSPIFQAQIEQSDSYIFQAILAIRDHYGAVSVVLVVAIVAPMVEEFLFRGVLLSAFARHISFVWANVFQAIIFAAIHLEPAAMPILFAFAVVAGIVARRSGGLLVCIVMHAVFNGLLLLFLLR
jgi:membrane protease YdiL (CAAX protease family)